MNDKHVSITRNADGQTVVVIADSASALSTAITAKKLDRKKGFNGA